MKSNNAVHGDDERMSKVAAKNSQMDGSRAVTDEEQTLSCSFFEPVGIPTRRSPLPTHVLHHVRYRCYSANNCP